MIEGEIMDKQIIFDNNYHDKILLNDKLKDKISNISICQFITIKKGRKFKSFDGELKNKNNYNVKRVHNKFSNDNVRRRIKALFNNYIIKLLNCLFKKRFKRIRMKFVKINSRITKNISIEYNRNLLDKKIKDIIIDISKKYQNKDNNLKLIKFIETQENTEEIQNIFNMTYKDLYTDYYLKSTKNDNQDNSYEAHKEKILVLYGKEYLDKYIKNVENFVEFFMNGKNRQNKKTNEIKSINIPLESESTENTYNNELINKENDKSSRKFTSIAIQTDISDINAKIIVFS
jgi:hypothetical protein